MPDPLLPINTILSRLAEYPQRIHAVTADLSEAKLHTHPAPDEWSANDVLAHVRACADVWGSYIARILSQDRPAIQAVSPRRYIDQTDYLEQEFTASLQAVTAQRAKLLEVLPVWAAEGWERQAIVTGVGNAIVRTLRSYSDRMTRHEREHVHQTEQLVGARRS